MTNERAIALVAAMHQYDGIGACTIEERQALRIMVQALVDKDALLEALRDIRGKAYWTSNMYMANNPKLRMAAIATVAEDAIANAEREP